MRPISHLRFSFIDLFYTLTCLINCHIQTHTKDELITLTYPYIKENGIHTRKNVIERKTIIRCRHCKEIVHIIEPQKRTL